MDSCCSIHTLQARIGIEKFCESFEKEMLEDFDKAYTEGDPRVMAVSFFLLFLLFTDKRNYS